MPTNEWFETRVMIAAEEARRAGFSQTYLALLDLLRASRCSDERMIGSLSTSHPTVTVRSQLDPNDGPSFLGFTNS